LHGRIDRLVAASLLGPPAPAASDGEFLRRAYLTLTGSIPSAAEARAFIENPDPLKRTALVDRLLAGSAYPRFMAAVFDIMLLERRPDQSVPTAEWRAYLEDAFARNKPFDELAREMLTADGTDAKLRPAAKFVLDRGVEPDLLTRDVGRLFFGHDLQCAQCHDHPLIDGFRQAEYYGLNAFFSRSSLFTDAKKVNLIADKADGDVSFKSVFKKKVTYVAWPQVPGGQSIPDPPIKPGDEYTTKPAKDVRPVPAYSRRLQLARELSAGRNRAFNRNIANRLWGQVMGRGLIDPPDLDHANNPASNEQLLDMLADEFATMKYDVRAFVRELAVTETFGRSFDLPTAVSQQVEAAVKQLPVVQAECARLGAELKLRKEALEKADDELANIAKGRMVVAEELTKAQAAAGEAKKAADAAAAALAPPQQQLAAKQGLASPIGEALAKTQDALKKLPGDKDLSDAAAGLQRKLAQVTSEIAKLKPNVDAAVAQVKAAQEKQAVAQKSVDVASGKIAAADQQVESVRRRNAEVFAAWSAHARAGVVAERRLSGAKLFVEYGGLRDSASAAQAGVQKLASDLAASRQSAQVLAASAVARQTEIAPLERAAADTGRVLAELQRVFASKEAAANAVADAAVKTESAQQKLPDNADLAEAARKLRGIADPMLAELANLRKNLAFREAAAKAGAEKLAAAVAAHRGAAAEAESTVRRIAVLESQLAAVTQKAAADRAAADAAFQKVTQLWSSQLATAALVPLSPEQIAWSTMQAVGVVDQQRAGVEAELNKKTPLTDAIKKDPAQMANRAKEIERMVYDKLKGNEATFVGLFSPGPAQSQQDFFATVDQALFFDNDGLVRNWLAPGGGNLTDRLVKAKDVKALADELYLSVLTRRPTDVESAQIVNYLAVPAERRTAAVQDLAWALLSSAEFRFRH
jgi:hypothetical protein